METDVIDIGLSKLTELELEKLATLLEEKILSYLTKSSHWKFLTDYNIIISLTQSSDNLLTLTIDTDIAGNITSEELTKLQEKIFNYAQDILKEELSCQKNS
ncbi:MAG: hypothetical protein ACFFDS_02595 [Candidatus Thorarchaeota archaeon]